MRFAVALTMAVAATVTFGTEADAQLLTDFSQTEITTTDLGNRIYMLQGEGGNIVVALADDGIIMIDSQFAPLHDKILAAIRALSDQPIRYLVNTHHHRDHTGGNASFAADGATIVSHVNMRDLLVSGTVSGLTGARTPPAEDAAIPTLTYTDSLTLELEGRTAQLGHPPDSHTNADSYIYFPDADVLVTGDIVTFGRYPNIDFVIGGHIDGMIEVTDLYIGMIGDDTKVVPGHGPVGSVETLREYRRMLATSRDRVRAAMAEGKSEDEIIAARPNADYDAAMNVEERRIANWVRVIYRSYQPN